jgi:large subunit ribosomal protein L23
MKTIFERPLISEKSLTLASRGWYTFLVDIKARKEEIARTIEKFYNVHVTQIRSIHVHGKIRRVGKMMKYVKKPDSKKVIVHLAKDQKIDAFEVTAPAKEQPQEQNKGKVKQ